MPSLLGALAPTQGSGQQTGQPPADGPAAETVADGQGVTQLGREAMLRIERNRAAAMARRVRILEVQRSDASTEAPMCAICKDQLYVTDDKYALPCAHAFHTECINKWAQAKGVLVNNCCPLRCGQGEIIPLIDDSEPPEAENPEGDAPEAVPLGSSS